MRKLTNNEFMEEINKANGEDKCFNVSSMDCGGIYVNLVDCKIEVSMDNGAEGEIIMFKPHTSMEVVIDFEVIDNIGEQDGTYYVELTNGSPDIQIEIHQQIAG
ncbi:MAG: hypothetical protein LUE99_03565 [Bacteroides sp.]|nr:hypothetical protein [Bacteroides sp.]